jgi:hypothetical protein
LAEAEGRPSTVVVGSHARDAPRVQRGPPWVSLEQYLRELAMGEHGLVTAVFSACGESMQERENAERVGPRESELDVAA